MIPSLAGCLLLQPPPLLPVSRGYLSHNICHNLTISHKKSLKSFTISEPSTILQYFRTSTPEHFGTGIYLVASLLNHSCSPNCTVVFQGRQLSIVATKDVPSGMRSGFRLFSLSGAWFVILSVWTALIEMEGTDSYRISPTECSFSGYIPNVAHITYVNSLDDTSTRREQLSTTWHFLCDCSLCANTK